MEIQHFSPSQLPGLKNALEQRRLVYGIGREYNSLLTPSITLLNHEECEQITEDLPALWQLYAIWNELYLDSIKGKLPEWFRAYCEYGLSKTEITVMQEAARAKLTPRFGRVDYVSLGKKRQIAEIQWKSGGLGLFFGIQDTYYQQLAIEQSSLGNLIPNFFQLVSQSASIISPVMVNGVRTPWYKSEHDLKRRALECGVEYYPFFRDELPRRIISRQKRFWIIDGGRLIPINFMYGQEFGDMLKSSLPLLLSSVLDGNLWIESPLNPVYRQKWGLSLPFHPIYRQLFPEKLREIIIPTVLLYPTDLDLSPIIPYLSLSNREQLANVRTITQIADLPTSLRRALVLKCGAGTGNYYSHGKGVFRINGSHNSARQTLDFIQDQVQTVGEPWVLQIYVDETNPVPVNLPNEPEKIAIIKAHARQMIFAVCPDGQAPHIIGGLGNYGAHWKIGGSAPGRDAQGHILGTAFNGIYVKWEES